MAPLRISKDAISSGLMSFIPVPLSLPVRALPLILEFSSYIGIPSTTIKGLVVEFSSNETALRILIFIPPEGPAAVEAIATPDAAP